MNNFKLKQGSISYLTKSVMVLLVTLLFFSTFLVLVGLLVLTGFELLTSKSNWVTIGLFVGCYFACKVLSHFSEALWSDYESMRLNQDSTLYKIGSRLQALMEHSAYKWFEFTIWFVLIISLCVMLNYFVPKMLADVKAHQVTSQAGFINEAAK